MQWRRFCVHILTKGGSVPAEVAQPLRQEVPHSLSLFHRLSVFHSQMCMKTHSFPQVVPLPPTFTESDEESELEGSRTAY